MKLHRSRLVAHLPRLAQNRAMTDRYDAAALLDFATALFRHAGLDEDKAEVVAATLLEGDLLGQTTHGLALLGGYLDEVAAGRVVGHGDPAVLAQTPVAQTWDGNRLPGPWLVTRAAEWASGAARQFGLGAVAIRRSGHIGCLAAYVERVASQGLMLLLTSSDPSTASVAPFGGTRRVITPNPIAAGWPTGGAPVMMDVSTSITTNGMTARLAKEGRNFGHNTLLDGHGQPTADPNAFFADPPGTLLPLGGAEAGHKGYALGLLIEALTSALAGHGRADGVGEWGASVFVQVIDPARFGGLPAFEREAGWLAGAVRANPAADAATPPRMPGERALARKAEQLRSGVSLHGSIPPVLADRGARAGIGVPLPIG